MKSALIILFLALSLSVFSQKKYCNCNNLKFGVFELYENDKKIGIIFRKNNYQIEKYVDNDKYIIGKIKSKKCQFLLKSNEIKKDIDSITWLLNYRRINKKHYSFIGKPKYLNVEYNYKGEIKKISNKVKNKEVLEIFKKLEEEENNKLKIN